MTDQVQIICDTQGAPAFAVLPIAEYERLVEAADDTIGARAFDAYMATRPETFPDNVAERLINGESPVRVFREYRGLTQRKLGDLAGVNQAYISQIEAGTRSGTIEVLKRIADGLHVELDDLT